MATTIQISENLQEALTKKKLYDRETYEEVIWDLIEDTKELDDMTKAEIAHARDEVKKGKVHTLTQVRKELGF